MSCLVQQDPTRPRMHIGTGYKARPHLNLPIPFQAQFKQFYQFLDHVKYELLNQDELQQVKYQEATLA